MQEVAEMHEILFSSLSVAPAGLGADNTLQVVPLHSSARGTCVPELSSKVPTAMQDVGLLQASAKRLPCETEGRAVLCRDQADLVAFASGGICLPAVRIWTDRLDAATAGETMAANDPPTSTAALMV
jgi:hypothetical protein